MTNKSLSVLIASALLLASGSAYAKPAASPSDEIAKIINGRSAGKPTDCIQQNQIASTQIINGTAIVYRMNDGTIYINRPSSGASFLRSNNVLMTDTHSDQLCSVDTVKLFDNGLHMSSGSIGLGTFVPFPRAPRGTAD